jgi:hypothetical protein
MKNWCEGCELTQETENILTETFPLYLCDECANQYFEEVYNSYPYEES